MQFQIDSDQISLYSVSEEHFLSIYGSNQSGINNISDNIVGALFGNNPQEIDGWGLPKVTHIEKGKPAAQSLVSLINTACAHVCLLLL